MDEVFFIEEFTSSLRNVRGAVERALKALERVDCVQEEHRYYVWLCLEEALTNAVRHGNRLDPERTVRIEMSKHGGRCRICVADDGEGFDIDNIGKPPPDALGGRGVFLIKCFMEDVNYDRERSCLEMFLPSASACQRGNKHD